MPRRSIRRFALEVLFLAGVAAAATIAELRPAGVIVLLALAWAVVALLEWTAWLDEPHYGRGLPPRYYVPNTALPPPRAVVQGGASYPVPRSRAPSAADDAPTFVASAAEWSTELADWTLLDSPWRGDRRRRPRRARARPRPARAAAAAACVRGDGRPAAAAPTRSRPRPPRWPRVVAATPARAARPGGACRRRSGSRRSRSTASTRWQRPAAAACGFAAARRRSRSGCPTGRRPTAASPSRCSSRRGPPAGERPARTAPGRARRGRPARDRVLARAHGPARPQGCCLAAAASGLLLGARRRERRRGGRDEDGLRDRHRGAYRRHREPRPALRCPRSTSPTGAATFSPR